MDLPVLFLLGKPPRPGTVVAAVLEELRDAGVSAVVALPHEDDAPVLARTSPGGVSMVVHRGLSGDAQEQVAALHHLGVQVCNPWPGTVRVRDRTVVRRALAGARLPTPTSWPVDTWDGALALQERLRASGGVVVKGSGPAGRGRGVLTTPLPGAAPGPGPWTVEELVEHDGTDRKLYAAGSWVRGLRKPSPLVGGHTTHGDPFDVGPVLRDLVGRTATALDLHLVGVDVVLGPDGPVVVDVNPFPGYRSVPGAAGAVTAHLLDHLSEPGGAGGPGDG